MFFIGDHVTLEIADFQSLQFDDPWIFPHPLSLQSGLMLFLEFGICLFRHKVVDDLTPLWTDFSASQ
jgi:hypothetical protein